MNSTYRLTEDGLVANFQQDCGCNAEGPKCAAGRALFKKMMKDQNKFDAGKMTMKDSDVSLDKWQEHLGA